MTVIKQDHNFIGMKIIHQPKDRSQFTSLRSSYRGTLVLEKLYLNVKGFGYEIQAVCDIGVDA